MKKLVIFILFLLLTGCAAFQAQPNLKTVTALDLYKYIDAKADSSQKEFDLLQVKHNQVLLEKRKILQSLTETNLFLNQEAKDGKLDKTTIEGLNLRGFNITIPDTELPSSLPDTTSAKNPNNLWPQ